MMKKYLIHALILIATFMFAKTDATGQAKGKLFIIGGGDRSDALMKDLMQTAALTQNDYIVILPMASGVPEESVDDMRKDFGELCKNPVTAFNFSKTDAEENSSWIDSVRSAKLIYITGGDQNRFMNVVKDSKLYDALHSAYKNGATVSGTSAGAAVMSEIMITGEEKDKEDKGNFRKIRKENAETATGMGFLTTAIIDQHFIKRGRYNRLLSVLADHPDKMVIGIDESTAIIVTSQKVKVAGESQVVVISFPKKLKVTEKNIPGFKNAVFSLLTAGDEFKLK